MNKKGITLTSMGIGFVVIIFTMVAFFAGFTNHRKEIIDWLALIFIVVSEVVFFAGIIASIYISSINKIFARAGIISALFIYWIVTTTLSVFARNIFVNNIGGFITSQVFICAITSIAVILLYVAAINIKEKDERLIFSKSLMQDCEELAFSLKSSVSSRPYYQLVNEIYEEIKYSDKTLLVDKEKAIYGQIMELSNLLNDNSEVTLQDVSKAADGIILLIKERNLAVQQLKQGGF